MRAVVLVLLLSSLFIWTCEETTEPTNVAPTIENIIYSPTSLETNSSVTFNAIAIDEDGDSLTYNWSSLQGTFNNSGIGNPIEWYITEPGEVEISCIVTDGKELDSKSISVSVAQEVGSLIGNIYSASNHERLSGASISIAGQTVYSSSDGTYSLENIATGNNQVLTVMLDTYSDYTFSIDISGGEQRKDIYLEKQTGVIFGYAYDYTNNQLVGTLSNVYITIEDESDYSASFGYWGIGGLSLGEHILFASKTGYQTYSDTIHILPGDNIYDIHMESD